MRLRCKQPVRALHHVGSDISLILGCRASRGRDQCPLAVHELLDSPRNGPARLPFVIATGISQSIVEDWLDDVDMIVFTA